MILKFCHFDTCAEPVEVERVTSDEKREFSVAKSHYFNVNNRKEIFVSLSEFHD